MSDIGKADVSSVPFLPLLYGWSLDMGSVLIGSFLRPA
jgi:hypothetical protein